MPSHCARGHRGIGKLVTQPGPKKGAAPVSRRVPEFSLARTEYAATDLEGPR